MFLTTSGILPLGGKVVYLGWLVFCIGGDLGDPCAASDRLVFGSSLLVLGVFLVVRDEKVDAICAGSVLLNAIARKVTLLLADETAPFSG